MVPDKQLPKHLLINLDDQDSEQQSSQISRDINQLAQYKKPQRIQINSLQSLRTNMIQTSPPKLALQSVSPAKKQAFILKQRTLKNEIIISDVESTSQIKSSTSMNTSTLNLIEGRFGKQLDEFSEEIENGQKSQSPQKLRKQGKGQFQSLLSPDSNLLFNCNQYLDKIYDRISQEPTTLQQIHQFLHTPLPPIQQKPFMRYVFQIHFYKYTFTFHSIYEFYLRNSSGQMLHLLKSQKDSLTVSSSHMLYACSSKEKQFTAKLKYNTVKSEYNLYDVDEKDNPHLARKLMASLFYQKVIGGERDMKLYVPKPEYVVENDFVKSQGKKNLAAFYDETKGYFDRKVEVLKTVPIPKDREESVRQEFQLKNEGRRILFQNEEGQQKFYMGKRQDQRYIILASCGLTPLQVFATAVANLDH